MPVDRRALVVVAEQTLALFPMPDNWAEQAAAWYSALADIPEDLIRVAFERVARNCRFWPRPAEVREQIAAELSERRVAVRRLKVAAAMLRRDAAFAERARASRKAMTADPIGQERAFVPPVKRHQDLQPCPEEIEVTPAEAEARVAEWKAELARTA